MAGEVSVQSFVARDELVAERQARHQSALLEPEDGAEATAEEDALDRGEGDEARGEALIAAGRRVPKSMRWGAAGRSIGDQTRFIKHA